MGWSTFLKHLKKRGRKAVEPVISDTCLGLVESVAKYDPEALWQRCILHQDHYAFSHVLGTKVPELALVMKPT